MSAASPAGDTTRANAPQLRSQLRSAQSWQTFIVSLRPPSSASLICCEACQTRARTYGATRASNSTSTRSAGPVFTPSELANTSSPIGCLGVKVSFSSDAEAMRSTANVRTSL